MTTSSIPTIALVGAGSNVGKTTLATRILERSRQTTLAVKFTTVTSRHRDLAGRLAPRALDGGFQIIGEPGIIGEEGKDTAKWAAVKAGPVGWCISAPTAIEEAWEGVAAWACQRDVALIVVEGGSVLEVADVSGVAVFSPKLARSRWKDNIWDRLREADLVVVNCGHEDREAGEELARELGKRAGEVEIIVDNLEGECRWLDEYLEKIGKGS